MAKTAQEMITQAAEVQVTEAQKVLKWDIKIYHRRRSGEFCVDVKTDHEGRLIGEVYTDSEELPKRVVCGERRFTLTYAEASYLIYKIGKVVIMIVDTSKDVNIKTGEEELDDVLNELKVPEEAKYEDNPKRAFAKRCSEMAIECEVPFEISMSFGGRKKDIVRFKQSFEIAKRNGKFTEKILKNFTKSISEDEAKTLLMLLKIYTGESKTCARIAKSVYGMATADNSHSE